MISIQNITGQLFLNTLPGLRMHHPQDLCFFNPQWPITFLSDPKTDTKVQSVKLLILKTDWGLGSHVSVLHVDKQILYTIFSDWHHLEDLTKKQLKTNIIFTRAEMVMAESK